MTVNELEERRVIRLLGELADAVEPLTEVDALLRPEPPLRSRRRVQPRAFAAVAAAAAVVLGTTVLAAGSQPSSHGQAPAHAQPASFPEGSALQLLISTRES